MRAQLLAFLLFVAFLFTAAADSVQETAQVSGPDSLISFLTKHGVSMAYSVQDKNKLADPARIQLQLPDEGENVYNINAGLSVELVSVSPYISLLAFAEYHRNSSTNSEVDSFKSGLASVVQWGDIASDKIVHYLPIKANIKKDNVQSSEGYQVSADYFPFISCRDNDGKGFALGGLNQVYGFSYLPEVSIGAMFEHSDNVKNAGSGEDLRIKLQAVLAIYPLGELLGNRLEIVGGFTYWTSASQGGGFNAVDGQRNLFKSSINYYLGTPVGDANKPPVAIGLDYFDGEDPDIGIVKQQYTALSLKMKF